MLEEEDRKETDKASKLIQKPSRRQLKCKPLLPDQGSRPTPLGTKTTVTEKLMYWRLR